MTLTLLFLFDLFLEASVEILEKFRWFFGRFEDTKRTPLNDLTFSKEQWPGLDVDCSKS